MIRSTYNKIEGLKKAIEIIQKEIDRLETIERDQANIERIDNEITK